MDDNIRMNDNALQILASHVHQSLTEEKRRRGLRGEIDNNSKKDLKIEINYIENELKERGRSMLSCYVQPPMPRTETLVPLSSVPHMYRDAIFQNGDSEDVIVEVPTAILESNDSSTTSSRPLTANLTQKLAEYTRGQTGRRKPFTPGGVSKDENRSSAFDKEDMKDSDRETRDRARRALDLGGPEAWAQNLLLTAPPGVTFDCGLSLYHINNEKTQKGTGGSNEMNNYIYEEDVVLGSDHQPSLLTTPENGISNSEFKLEENDSIFGSSSSESSIDSDVETDEALHKIEDEKFKVVGGSSDSVALIGLLNLDDVNTGENDIKDDPDEDNLLVDAILQEMASPARKPIDLKNYKSTNADGENRKSWAVTTYLPLKNFYAQIPDLAIRYPFELDDFQKQAVLRLERKECIFVAAHTSAGKTVCAEYAIALAKKHCTRAIYTSPIKALSNQKYRDFKKKFGDDVGLITGDMQIGADSSCLIMTTEILRSMLYRGADLVRDIEWVIFDEVHYINDSERGVVWEEVIIMLPDYVNMIFLSATTPNTIEFSDWIGRTKQKPVHVIRTNYRPVPLSHYLFASNEIFAIKEGQSGFLEKGYRDAAKNLLPPSERDPNKKVMAAAKKGSAAAASAGRGRGGGRGGGGRGSSASSKKVPQGNKDMAWQHSGNKQNWTSLIKFLDRELLTPTVVFSFSKKKCEEIATMLRGIDLNTNTERSAAMGFGLQTMKRLSANDASLPQVQTMVEMVQRGIGVHHGGLLPILKEMVEILFSRNLIKILFATETFAMGVNMPARAVVFNSIRKHDGMRFRELEPGEYTQMAGRAGRRGLDTVGTVIIACFGEVPPPPFILRKILTGSSTRLSSQFRLTYNMILNLLRVEDMSVEGMIKRSFSEFATQRALTSNDYPRLLEKGKKTLAKLDSNTKLGNEEIDVESYYWACRQLILLNNKLLMDVFYNGNSNNGGGILVPGRLLIITSGRKGGYVWGVAIVLRSPIVTYSESGSGKQREERSNHLPFQTKQPTLCMTLLPKDFDHLRKKDQSASKSESEDGELFRIGFCQDRHYAIHEVDFNQILVMTNIKHKIDYAALLKHDAEKNTLKSPWAKSINSPSKERIDSSFANFKSIGKKMSHGENDKMFGKKRGMKTFSMQDNQFMKESFEIGSTKTAEEVVLSLLKDAEAKELQTFKQENDMLPIISMKECTKGNVHHSGADAAFDFQNLCAEMVHAVRAVRNNPCHADPKIEPMYTAVVRKETLRQMVNTLQHLLSNESLNLFPDFLQRKAVLRTLGYINEQDSVLVKGYVACEVNSCEELIVTEMILEGLLNDLEPAEIAAALSALIFQEKGAGSVLDRGSNTEGEGEKKDELPERLLSCCERMRVIALNLGKLQREYGLDIVPTDYVDHSLKFGLVQVVYEWALGVPFYNICELTIVQEGSIVRCITRLDELCREVRNCARVIGNSTLFRRMEDASIAIKRDIVFASSLYVS